MDRNTGIWGTHMLDHDSINRVLPFTYPLPKCYIVRNGLMSMDQSSNEARLLDLLRNFELDYAFYIIEIIDVPRTETESRRKKLDQKLREINQLKTLIDSGLMEFIPYIRLLNNPPIEPCTAVYNYFKGCFEAIVNNPSEIYQLYHEMKCYNNFIQIKNLEGVMCWDDICEKRLAPVSEQYKRDDVTFTLRDSSASGDVDSVNIVNILNTAYGKR